MYDRQTQPIAVIRQADIAIANRCGNSCRDVSRGMIKNPEKACNTTTCLRVRPRICYRQQPAMVPAVLCLRTGGSVHRTSKKHLKRRGLMTLHLCLVLATYSSAKRVVFLLFVVLHDNAEQHTKTLSCSVRQRGILRCSTYVAR